MLTQNELNELAISYWDIFNAKFAGNRKFACPKIILNNRIYRTAGRCFVENNYIDISAKLLANPANVAEMCNVILPHELAHQVDYNLNGAPKNNRWHGRTWSHIMVQFGLEPNPYHSLNV